MESKKIYDIDLTELGFVDDTLETEHHTVSYVFYDIGRLMIQSKPKYGGDEVYVEDYFELEKFINIIFYVTGFKIQA
jgi:hypothetical protein